MKYMATLGAPTVRPEESARVAAVPLLEQGDRLSRAELELVVEIVRSSRAYDLHQKKGGLSPQ